MVNRLVGSATGAVGIVEIGLIPTLVLCPLLLRNGFLLSLLSLKKRMCYFIISIVCGCLFLLLL